MERIYDIIEKAMDTIKVVCGVIFKDEKILICRRAAHKSLPGLWEFPGGKIEVGEMIEQSLVRELNEELGMTVIIQKHFKTVIHSYEKFKVELISFFCVFLEASFILVDHDKYEWIEPSGLIKYELAPADVPLANELINNHKTSKV